MTAVRDPETLAVRREGRSFYVPSRTRHGLVHRIDWSLDGSLLCNCEAASLGKRECWAEALIREELAMNETQESTALQPVQVMRPESLLPTERTYSLIDKAARLAFSGAVALPKELNTPEKVGAVMLYGWELGLRPMTAIQELYIVNGRVQPSARIMAGLLASRTDATIKIVESTDRKCTLRLIWPSRDLDENYTVEWTEVERAKLANRDVWASYPRDKLITHCTKRLLRVFAPDIINGIVGPLIDRGFEVADDEEDAFDNAELYNPGDDPEKSYIDGQAVNRETGEIVEHGQAQQAPPPAAAAAPGALGRDAAPELNHLIADWQAQLQEREGGRELLKEIVAASKDKYAYAVEGGKFKPSLLNSEDSAAYLAELRLACGEPAQPSLVLARQFEGEKEGERR